MAQIVTTKGGYATIVLESSTNDKMVSANVYPAATTTKTLHDVATGSDYQVPANRKLIITAFTYCFAGNSVAEIRLWNSASADSATGTQMIWDIQTVNATGNLTYTIPFYAEIAENRYVNLNETAGGLIWGSISGVETDA